MKTTRDEGMGRRDFLRMSLAGGAVAAGLAGPATAQGTKIIRFGHMLPTDQIHHKAVALFGDEMAKLSGGKIKVEIFPSSQLGTISEMLQSVQAGSLTMSMAVPAWYSSFMKPVDAFTLPYLVANADRLRAALDGQIGAQIGKMGEGVNFKVLGYFLLGGRHIVNKVRAVQKPADCQGLKLRVINNPVYLQTFRLLGANPVAMDPSELYLATQQGVVDGFEYPLPDLVAQKMYEVIKYVSLDQHTTDFFIISTSKKTWDATPPDEQKMIQAAWKTACDWQWKEQPAEIEKALARLKTLVAVNEITPDNKKLFIEATRPVYKQFEPTIGKDFLDLAIKELG